MLGKVGNEDSDQNETIVEGIAPMFSHEYPSRCCYIGHTWTVQSSRSLARLASRNEGSRYPSLQYTVAFHSFWFGNGGEWKILVQSSNRDIGPQGETDNEASLEIMRGFFRGCLI